MTRNQQNSKTMGNSVTETLQQNSPVWSGSPVFSDSVTQHGDNMNVIADWENKQASAIEIKGLVRDKNILRTLMIGEAVIIVSAIKAFAEHTNNQQLAMSVDYSKSKLAQMSEDNFLAACNNIKAVAAANAAALIPYGVTDQLQEDFAGDLVAFDSIMKKPKAMRGQAKTYTAKLKLAVLAMTLYLRNTMDNLVKSMYAGTDFASYYFNSRKTYKQLSPATGFRGTVYNHDNGNVLANVIVEMVDYPNPGDVEIRSTNSKGNYAYLQVSADKVTLRVRAAGYTTAEMEVTLGSGKITDFDIRLMPQPAPVPQPVV
jgi:hypothetical protein